MNIWRIALKEMLAIRDVKMLLMIIATPVLITLILGTVLTNAFNGSVAVGEIRVLYTNNSADGDLTKSWNRFIGQAAQSGIHFEQAGGNTDGRLEVTNNRYVGYAEITDGGMSFYGSSLSRVESDIARSMLEAFADRYRLAAELAKESPEQASVVMSGGERADYVRETALNAARQPSAMDYYAVAMTTLIILYGAMTAAQLIDGERKRNTANRLLASPVTKVEIFAGKVAGFFLFNAIGIVIVVLLFKYMFQVYWGEHLGWVFLVLFTEIVFALSLGLGFSYFFKGNAGGSIVMIIIQIGAFIGGSYFPLASLTGTLKTLTNFSPLKWSNDALLQLIYADSGAAAVNAMLLNLGFSVLLLGASLFILRKREGL